MGYLVTHMAACLIFAQLLGLLLGWLLWGYMARQRAVEVQSLRERIADMQVLAPQMAYAGVSRAALAEPKTTIETEPAKPVRGPIIEDDLTPSKPRPELEQAALPPAAFQPFPVQPDLEAEIREARLQHFEMQVRELEAFRDRIPILEATLNEAVAGRKAAEIKLQEVETQYDTRSTNMLGQIRDFERAAFEWEHTRDQSERDGIARDKELNAVKAQLRDIQNNQLPQKAEPAGVSELEHADLRDRYQKALRERDAIAAQLETWKQTEGVASADSQRIAELETAMQAKDIRLAEQLAQVETLLWRVAELEPYAAAVPRLEDDKRRQESEIAGHVAMHAESSDHIRALLNRVAELEPVSTKAEELQQHVQQQEATLASMTREHAGQLSELHELLDRKNGEIQGHVALHADSTESVRSLTARVTELEAATGRVQELEGVLQNRDHAMSQLAQDHSRQVNEWQDLLDAANRDKGKLLAEHLAERDELSSRLASIEKQFRTESARAKDLLSEHANLQHVLETANGRVLELELVAGRNSELERLLHEQGRELKNLQDAHADKEGQLTFIQGQLAGLSERLGAAQHRMSELETLAAKVPEAEQKLARQEEESRSRLKALEEKHDTERTRLKVNSAQSLRRLRKGITNFTG